jgi:hypothetical protein
MHIKSYRSFLNESNDSDPILDLVRNLTRNYETTRTFYTDQVQYSPEEEHKDWVKPLDYVELEKPITKAAKYSLVFLLDGKVYRIRINFSFTINGKKEKDAPETASEADLGRLNIVLEDVEVKNFRVKSQSLDVEKTSGSMEDRLKKAVITFLVKMLSTEYDSLGGKIYSLEQT